MHWSERLSEYQDGELSPSERAACDAHLAECQTCRSAFEELQLLTSLAKTDADVMPANDLWPGILTKIEALSTATDLSAATDSGSFFAPIPFPKKDPESLAAKRISFTLPQLALAASLLIAVSSGVA
jgi:anti-sigma factor ChrR (cupin superfamily)